MIDKKVSSRNEKGQSLVELSLSIIVLLILLAGVSDIGRAFFTFISLRDAAQEGASFGAAYPTFCTQIRERVKNTSNTPIDLGELSDSDISVLISGVDCDVAVTLGLACTPNEIKIEVVMNNFQISTPFLGEILGSQQLSLSADVADTIISNPCSGP